MTNNIHVAYFESIKQIYDKKSLNSDGIINSNEIESAVQIKANNLRLKK